MMKEFMMYTRNVKNKIKSVHKSICKTMTLEQHWLPSALLSLLYKVFFFLLLSHSLAWVSYESLIHGEYVKSIFLIVKLRIQSVTGIKWDKKTPVEVKPIAFWTSDSNHRATGFSFI